MVVVASFTIVLFDLLFAGVYLASMSAEKRLEELAGCCGPTQPEERGRALVVKQVGESNLWLAESFDDDFLFHFDEFWDDDEGGNDKWPEIEGLILRRRDGLLLSGDRLQDVEWMLRCRKPKPNVYNYF